MARITVKKSLAYGAIAGIVAGIIMMGIAMSTTIMIGMPYDTIPKAIGTAFGSNYAIPTGIGLHLLTSTLVGMIFGVAVSSTRKLEITSVGKGILLGLVTGMIAFVVISIPVTTFVLPPVLVKFLMHMHPDMSQHMAMSTLQQKKILITSTAILRHLVYGAVLGVITSIMVLRKLDTATK